MRHPPSVANPVSRVLLRNGCCALYHLSTIAVTRNLQRPTPRHRASNPHLSVYMALQPVRRTAGEHCCLRGGLLPRLFTLTGRRTGGYSLLRYYTLTDVKPLTWTVLCVARTFLPSRLSCSAAVSGYGRDCASDASRTVFRPPLLTGEQR